MTLQDLGSLGELVAAIATVVTLLYLAVQIRQNTMTARSASTASYVQAITGVSTLLAERPELSDLYFKGLEDPDSLTDSERRRFTVLLGSFITFLQQAHQMELDGTLSPELAQQYGRQLDWLVCQPGFLAWHNAWGSTNPPGFAAKVSESMRRGSAAGRLGIFSESAGPPATSRDPGSAA